MLVVAEPLVKEVFKKHNVLYIQENAFWRTWKTFVSALTVPTAT